MHTAEKGYFLGERGFHIESLVMKYLIGFFGRDQPDLKMPCAQVQLENVNEKYSGFRKYCMNLSTI